MLTAFMQLIVLVVCGLHSLISKCNVQDKAMLCFDLTGLLCSDELGQKGQGARYKCMFLEPNGKMLQEISDLIEQVYLCPCFGFLDLLAFLAGCAGVLPS